MPTCLSLLLLLPVAWLPATSGVPTVEPVQAQAPAAPAAAPPALEQMAATERAFAAATAEIGVRDGFLTFFAPDAVQIVPGESGAATRLVPAREALERGRPAPLPLAAVLEWAPFTGQASADGTMGWLTGGWVNRATATGAVAGQGAYFSVWRRQADGTWRVWLDEGIGLPEVWRDASSFRPAPEPDAGAIAGGRESVEDAERAVAAGGDAWRARLAAGVRVHREGHMPIAGADAAAAWARDHFQRVTFTTTRVLAAGSDDLAIAIGGYDATTTAGPEHGTWVRVWRRDAAGGWRIVFETSK